LIEFNVLDVNDMRRVDFCPSHFFVSQKTLKSEQSNHLIKNWIYEHTQGRFYLGAAPWPEVPVQSIKVGFESSKDLLLFELCYKEEW
jgi:hypothetical protein